MILFLEAPKALNTLPSILFAAMTLSAWGLSALAQPGAVDATFDSNTAIIGSVHAMALQADGKIVVGGSFTQVRGISQTVPARIQTNGLLDRAYNRTSGVDGFVEAMAVQPDGKVIIGGSFASYSGSTRASVARIANDGSLDSSFNCSVDSYIYAMALQPDGKVVLAGVFNSVNGTARGHLARVNSDGSIERNFNSTLGANDEIKTVTVLPNGKLVIAGSFTQYNSTNRQFVARLNADGNLDGTFKPDAIAGAFVSQVAYQKDGKLFIVGPFTAVNGIARNGLARLNADGTLDTSFDQGPGLTDVTSIAVQSDGKLLVGTTGAQAFLSRLKSSGEVDASFTPALLATNNALQINLILLQPNGKITASLSSPGTGVAHLVRLLGDLPSVSLTANRNGSISVSGAIGSKVRIEFNSDLATTNWISLTNLVLPGSPYLLSDPQTSGSNNRFYRAASLP